VRRRWSLIALLITLVAWNSALLAAPSATLSPTVTALTYLAGAQICHQRPDRSFDRAGVQYPVCARCLGLYGGAALGALGWMLLSGLGVTPHRRAARWVRHDVPRRALVLVGIPTLASVALAWSGLWDAGNSLRAALALPLGAVIAAAIAAVAAGDLR
jgi:uncharacterized membrane protein